MTNRCRWEGRPFVHLPTVLRRSKMKWQIADGRLASRQESAMNSLVEFLNSPSVELFAKVCGIIGSLWACGVVIVKIAAWLKGQTLQRLGVYVTASMVFL